jgi:site-specific recombinase XerD
MAHSQFNRRLVKRYEQWMVIQRYSIGTKAVYRQTLRLYVDFLKKKPIVSVTQTDIRKFMLRLSENGVSLISARRHLTALRRFYDFLNLGGLVNYAVPRFVSVRQTPAKIPMHLSEEEVIRLMAAAETPREKAFLEFVYGTGSRLGEILCLRVADLDLEARTARVTGKYGKTRVVLLTERAADALRDYIGDRKIGYVFQQEYARPRGNLTNNKGGWTAQWYDRGKYGRKYLGRVSKVSRETVERELAEIMKTVQGRKPKNGPLTSATFVHLMKDLGHRAGLPHVHCHMLRRTFATHLHENGADLTAIQKLLGHVCIETTAKYANLSAFRIVDVFERCHPFGKFHVKGSPKHAESIDEEKRAEKFAREDND